MTKYLKDEIDPKNTQLRKGILELAILSALYRQVHYGYSLVRLLSLSGDLDIKEGTIYPILARMAKEGLVSSEWSESNQGPPRKYYGLTDAGRIMCERLNREFRLLVRLVDHASQEESTDSLPDPQKKISLRSNDHE